MTRQRTTRRRGERNAGSPADETATAESASESARSPKRRFRINLRVYFTLIVLLAILATVLLTQLLGFLVSSIFRTVIDIPPLVWFVLLAIVLGIIIALIVGKQFSDPVANLSSAMTKVAGGDFAIRLEPESRIPELEEAYESFNLMAGDLAATEMLQADFVSNVSHEIKTPINAIEGYAMLLQDGDQSPEERQQDVEKILSNTRRLSELVGNVLLLSKVDNQTGAPKTATYRLDEQIRTAIVLLEPNWSAKEIDFDVDLAEVSYTGNESLMLHVWSNLIGNAIKFAPYAGLVRLRLHEADGVIVFSIDDNGPGIPDEEQRHIFDRFYQGDSSHREEGNGLGLALVKRILDTCGGRIAMANLPEAGCRFTVTLPAELPAGRPGGR